MRRYRFLEKAHNYDGPLVVDLNEFVSSSPKLHVQYSNLCCNGGGAFLKTKSKNVFEISVHISFSCCNYTLVSYRRTSAIK